MVVVWSSMEYGYAEGMLVTGGIWFRRVGLHVMPCLVRPEFVKLLTVLLAFAPQT